MANRKHRERGDGCSIINAASSATPSPLNGERAGVRGENTATRAMRLDNFVVQVSIGCFVFMVSVR
jgi:hypothetical protein